MMNIENYKKKLESMSREELLQEISNLISDHGIQLQNKNIELQELESSLANADLQFQFQIGEVDLRDKEIESLKGKRKPEDKSEVEYSPFLMCENYGLYLRSMSKEELIEYFYSVTDNYRNLSDKSALENMELEKQVNCLKQEMEEKNTYEEKLNSMIDNLRDDISEQKAEIERLTEEKKTAWQKFKQKVDESIELSMLLDKRAGEKAELQKQVEQLLEERVIINKDYLQECEEHLKTVQIVKELQKQVDGLSIDLENWKKAAYGYKYAEEQAVKNTAKEILQEGKHCLSKSLQDWIKEHCGVEME